jgi:hypothetical protein
MKLNTTLTPTTPLINYIRLSRIWKRKPDIDLPLRFSFWFIIKWQWPKDLLYISFESFMTSQKYRQIEHSADMLLRIYNPKRWRWLYKRMIMIMPLKKALPLYEHYLTEIVKVEALLKKQSDIYEKTQEQKLDMAEFGYTNIIFLLCGGNRKVMDWISKQTVIYVINEYRREISIRENERFFLEKSLPKSKK